MSHPLKILHLEDNKNDAELVKEILLFNDINCEIVHVDNRADFESELVKGDLSIILADYNLPSFDGLVALALAKEKKPAVPFIFISGVLGEELAIETLKRGATDYVIKSRLERLAPAIGRALREKEEHAQRIRLEREIVELEQMRDELQSIYQQLTRRVRGFLKIDLPFGKYSLVDKFLEDLSGYEIKAWKEKPHFIKEIVHPEFSSYYNQQMDQLKDEIVPKMLEYKIVKKDGEERWWLQFNIGAFDVDGKLMSVSAVIVDNTEDKEAYIKFQNIFENALMGMYRSDIDTGEIIDANNKLAKIFGFDSVENFKKCNAFDFYQNKEERLKIMDQLRKKGYYEEHQIQLKRIDGSLAWVSESARIYPKEGYVEGMMIDITDRKLAEDAIVRNRKAFQIIAEAAIHSQDISILCQKILDGLVETFGFDAGIILLYNANQKLLEPVAVAVETADNAKDLFPISINNPNYLNALVARTGKAVFINDITQDEELRKYQTRIDEPISKASISYPIFSGENALLGVLQLVSKDAREISEEDKLLFETIVDLFSTALEHKRSTRALQDSEEKFRTFAEQSLLGVSIVALPGEFTFVNEEFERISGFSQSELLTMTIRDLTAQILTTQQRIDFQIIIDNMLETLEPIKTEFLIQTKDGKEKWININVAPILNAAGEYKSSGAVILDITEQKRAQMTLERERQAFHILAEASVHAKDIPQLCKRILTGLVDVLQFDVGTFRLYDEKERILDLIAVTMEDESRIKEIKPLSIDDETYLNTFVARSKQAVFAPDISKHAIAKRFQKRVDKFSAKANITWPIVSTKGDLIGTIQISANTTKEFPDEDRFFFDTIIRFFAAALERRWTEEALLESQAQYRRLIDSSPFAIINTNLDGKIIRANHQAVIIFGYNIESDFVGKNFFDLFVDGNKTKVMGHTKTIIESGIINIDEYKVQNKQKQELIIDLSASLVLNENNVPETLIFIGQDITTKKAVEEEQKRFMDVVTSSNEVIISATLSGKIFSVNPAIKNVFGYTVKETIGKNISFLASPNQKASQKQFFKKAIKNNRVTFETVGTHKDGHSIPVIMNLSVTKDEKDKVIFVNAIIIDISDIRKLEE